MNFTAIILSVLILSSNSAEIIKKSSSRVAGGRPVSLGEIPYFASIQMIEGSTGQNFQCGGSLIRYNWILTLARCLSQSYSEFYVELGKVNRNVAATWEARIIDRSAIYLHPNYSSLINLNDIGLINLRDATIDLLNNSFIDSISLPQYEDKNLNLIGMRSYVSGFGGNGGSAMSNVLNVADMLVVDNQECRDAFPSLISDENLCTETIGGRSPCVGDDGGPLTSVLPQNRHTLIGIVGLTVEGCTWGIPGVFTRVSHHLDWIYSVIEDEVTTTTLIDETTTLTISEETTTEVESTTSDSEPTTTEETTTETSPTTTEFYSTSTEETTSTESSTITTEITTTQSESTSQTQSTTIEPSTTENVPLSAPKSVKLSFALSVLFFAALIVNF